MPTPKNHQLQIPNHSPSSTAQHTENLLRMEQNSRDLPFFEDFIYQRFINDTTSVAYGNGDFELMHSNWQANFTKLYDNTDMICHFTYGGRALNNPSAVQWVFRLINERGVIIDPMIYIGLLQMDTVGPRYNGTWFSRWRGIPAGRYRMRLAWGLSFNSNGRAVQVDTGTPLAVHLRETALGLDKGVGSNQGMRTNPNAKIL